MKKNKTIAWVIPVVSILIVAIIVCTVVLVPHSQGFLDVYENHTSSKEFTSYEVAIESLPEGWSLYAPSTSSSEFKNSNSGYIKELDAFVVKKALNSTNYLSIVKCGTNELMFQENLAITAIRVSNGHIVLKSANGGMFITNYNGEIIIPQGVITGAGNSTIDNAVKVLDNELIAINPNYDKNASDNKSYTSIYRSSTKEVAVRVKNAGASLSALMGFDGKYVVSAGTTEDGVDVSRIFSIPKNAVVENSNGTEYGTYYDNGNDNYYTEITYMGNDKFFIHEEWTIEEHEIEDHGAEYSFVYDDEYFVVSRFIYDASQDTRTNYVSDYYFLNLSNHYYGADRNGFATQNLIKEGYYYASYCIYVTTVNTYDKETDELISSVKEGNYDQFILNKDLEIVYSLSGNFGEVKKTAEDMDSVSYFDLAISFVDGIGVVPLPSAQLRVIDSEGKVLFTIDKTVTSAAYNNGMIIASTLNPKGQTIYAVYDVKGNEIVPFSKGFTEINPFLGYYTIAKLDGKTVLLSKDGTIVEKMSDNATEPFQDIAKTSSNTDIYKLGCYMFAETRTSELTGEQVKYYGIKNLSTDVNNNVLIEANMVSGSLLYAPTGNPDMVYVFAKFEGSDTFTVYKLTTGNN